MTNGNSIEFLFEEDSTDRADEMWAALRREDHIVGGIEEFEYLDETEWEAWSIPRQISWDPLTDVTIQASAGKSDAEQAWAVPDDTSYVELTYDGSPMVDAVAADRDGDIEDSVAALVDLVTLLYEAVSEKPLVVYGPSSAHLERLAGNEMSLPVSAESDGDPVEYTCWLMVFPPTLVESYGREPLSDVDVYLSRDLTDGAILTVAYDRPIRSGRTKHIDRRLGLDSPSVDDDRY